MKDISYKDILDNHPSADIIEKLTPFVSDTRKSRIADVIAGRLASIQLAIEAPSDINNALAAVRSAESLGVSQVHLICPEGDAVAAKPITQGAFYWVSIHYHDNLKAFLDYCKNEGLLIAGGTVTATQPLHQVPVDKPLCILIGNESRGLSDAAVSACDIEYKIPMVGMSESLNLSVSAALSMYDTTQRKRQLLNGNSDLSIEQQQALQALYYLNSANARMYPHLF
ncbi:MAG: RNA methyltransferase [Coxiellaceae bacterium]|nr:RNA methyltransferase [Coxiellaceae bacterium]